MFRSRPSSMRSKTRAANGAFLGGVAASGDSASDDFAELGIVAGVGSAVWLVRRFRSRRGGRVVQQTETPPVIQSNVRRLG